MTLVNTMPTRIPSRGLAKEVMALMNTSLSRRGSTAPLMAVIPYISTAKPSRISPTWRVVCFLLIIRSRVPMVAIRAVRVEVLSRATQPPPDRLLRHSTQPVTLVPKMAPSTMPMA